MWSSFAKAFIGIGLVCGWLCGCAGTAEEEIAARLTGPPEGKVLPDREDYFAVQVVDQDNAWVVGKRGAILHLSRGGEEISLQKSGVENALYAVSFADARNGLVGGQQGTLLRTSDGGKSWTKIDLPQLTKSDQHVFSLARGTDVNQVWAVGPWGTVLHSQDGGKTWQDFSLGEDITLNDVYFLNDTEGWVVGEFGLIFHTVDGGQQWEKQTHILNLPKYAERDVSEEEAAKRFLPPLELRQLFFFSVSFISPEEGFVAGNSGLLLRTGDKGASWEVISSGTYNTLLAFAPSARNGSVAVGVLGTMVAEREKGWQLMGEVREQVLTWLRDVSWAREGGFGLACGGKGTILVTRDGGKTWRRIGEDKLAAIRLGEDRIQRARPGSER